MRAAALCFTIFAVAAAATAQSGAPTGTAQQTTSPAGKTQQPPASGSTTKPPGTTGTTTQQPSTPAPREPRRPTSTVESPPPGTAGAAHSRPTSAVPSYRDLKFPPLKPIEIPRVETFTLPNGMKVFLLEDHELPLVNGTARVRTGNLFDPADKVGLATMTGMVMRTGGTKDKTGNELDVLLENMAASVESNIGETSGSVSFSALKENTDAVLALFRDVMTAPEFRQDKIDLAKTQLRSSIARRNDEPHGLSQREFASVVYGRNTPYGWDMQYATVDRITRADLLAFYQRYYFPANVLLAVWGDFSTPEMKARLERLFGNWTVKQDPVPPFPKVQNPPAPGTYLAVKQDVTQTFFVAGHLGGELRDKDYPALEVMADILGGGFRSRLVSRVRTAMGWAYDISANWGSTYDHPGLFEVAGSTKSESTVDTIKAVQEEIERIRTSEVTEEELKTAKDTALNSLVFAFDTKAKTLGRMLTYEYYGYPQDFIQQYQKALQAVTRADILRVAKAHLRPQDLTVVTVGNPADFGKSLDALGRPVTKLDISIPQPKSAESSESLRKGKELLARVQQAAGGAEKLAAVKDAYEETSFQLDPASGGMKVHQTNRWIAPAYFREDSTLPMGKIAAYSDGRIGWISTPQGAGALGGPQLKQVQGEVFRQYFRILLSDRIEGRKVNLVNPNTLEISDGEQSAKLVVDPATGLPKQMIYPSVQVTGKPVDVVATYSDFRDTAGIKVPYHISIMQGDRKFAEVTVEQYRINSGLKPEELEKRP